MSCIESLIKGNGVADTMDVHFSHWPNIPTLFFRNKKVRIKTFKNNNNNNKSSIFNLLVCDEEYIWSVFSAERSMGPIHITLKILAFPNTLQQTNSNGLIWWVGLKSLQKKKNQNLNDFLNKHWNYFLNKGKKTIKLPLQTTNRS